MTYIIFVEDFYDNVRSFKYSKNNEVEKLSVIQQAYNSLNKKVETEFEGVPIEVTLFNIQCNELFIKKLLTDSCWFDVTADIERLGVK